MKRYRHDIDGLRALAVTLVVVFHAVPVLASGGYLGVDVFFVISGFLITSILLRDLESGSFSLIDFWERRIRRIMPALVVMVFACLLVGTLLMLPKDLAELGECSLFQSIFLANVYFWRDTGYFATASELKPLLHTWSLAVEEQFYVFFPSLLFLISKKGNRLKHAVFWVLFFGSFATCIFASTRYPSANFFLLPTRTWELLAGSILALNPKVGASGSERLGWLRTTIAASGLAMIVVPGFAYDADTIFPGFATVLPVLGTVCLLATGKIDNPVSRLLSWKPIAFVGLISYSWYLWHWPLLAFPRYLLGDNFTLPARLAAVAVSIVFAILSWKYVETPFRSKTILSTTLRSYGAGACAIIGLLIVSIAIEQNAGFPARYSDEDLQFLSQLEVHSGVDAATLDDIQNDRVPVLGSSNTTPLFILWGDSHAKMLEISLEKMGKQHGWSFHTVAKDGYAGQIVSSKQGAINRNKEILRFIQRTDCKHVLFVSRWSWSFRPLTENRLSSEQSKQIKLALPALVNQLEVLGVRSTIMAEVPCQEHGDAYGTYIGVNRIHPKLCGLSRVSSQAYLETRRSIQEILQSCHADILDPSPYCFDDEGKSIISIDGASVYQDDDHFTNHGVEQLLGKLLTSWVETIRSPRRQSLSKP